MAAPAASSAASNVISVQIVSHRVRPRVVRTCSIVGCVAARRIRLRRRSALREARSVHGVHRSVPATRVTAPSDGARSRGGLRARIELPPRLPRRRDGATSQSLRSRHAARSGYAPFRPLGASLAAVVCSSALVAMAAAGGPLRAASESLKAKLAELSPLGAGLTIETRPAPGNARTDAGRRAAARKLGLRLPSTRRSARSSRPPALHRSVARPSKEAYRSSSSDGAGRRTGHRPARAGPQSQRGHRRRGRPRGSRA